MTNRLLEQYLEKVGAKLTALPELERQHQIAEIRQHLESLIGGVQAHGETGENATILAIRQFDAADRVGVDLRRVGLRGRIGQIPEFVMATLVCGAMEFVFLSLNTFLLPLVNGARNHHFSAGVLPAWVISLFCCLVLCLSMDRRELVRRIRTQPIICEAVTWSLMTGTLSFLMSCYIYSQPSGKTGLWENVAYFVVPTLLAVVRPVRTRSGMGVAAAILPQLPAYIISILFLMLGKVPASTLVTWALLPTIFLLSLPFLVVTGLRLRLKSGSEGWGSARFVLK